MNDLVLWIAAEAERPVGSLPERRGFGPGEEELRGIKPHNFGESFTTEGTERNTGSQNPHPFDKLRAGSVSAESAETRVGHPLDLSRPPDLTQTPDSFQPLELSYEEERERRIYRGRTVAMLRRYMRYSLETGRLPSILGREFFRAKVTSYTVVTFEDRVIFVHDMEKCLDKLDEFSRQLIARHVLQEHDRWATARLLGCNEKTVRRLTPMAIDQLSEILLDMGLMERLDGNCRNSCQGGEEGEIFVSDCEDDK